MKTAFILALALFQLSAHASRTPELYCLSDDGSIEIKVFNDSNRERESQFSQIDSGKKKMSQTTAVKKSVGNTVEYISDDYYLRVNLDQKFQDGLQGSLLLNSNESDVVSMSCRIIK